MVLGGSRTSKVAEQEVFSVRITACCKAIYVSRNGSIAARHRSISGTDIGALERLADRGRMQQISPFIIILCFRQCSIRTTLYIYTVGLIKIPIVIQAFGTGIITKPEFIFETVIRSVYTGF